MYRAVVFDLWQTLAAWPEEQSTELRRFWSGRLGITHARLDALWDRGELYRQRETGPIAPAIAAVHDALGAHADVDEILARRVELTRAALVPVDGALATLRELHDRGVPIGLISNCTEEVALVWETTPFGGLFDVAVFSATAGCMKPDPRIYEMAIDALGVPAHEALFVGDGANDELEGARRVGMFPVLLCDRDGRPAWEALASWEGARISHLGGVLDLVDAG